MIEEAPGPGLVIVAGGENTRLRPLADTVYKPFVAINGLSLVARHHMRAENAGVSPTIVVTDVRDPMASHLAGESSGRMLHTVIPGSVRDKIVECAARFPTWRPLLVALGDTLARVDLRALAGAPARLGTDSPVAAGRVRSRFGHLDLNGHLVTRFDEKPIGASVVNVGYMALGARALQHLAEIGDLAACLEWLARERELGVSEIVDDFVCVDDLSDLARAHEVLHTHDEQEQP